MRETPVYSGATARGTKVQKHGRVIAPGRRSPPILVRNGKRLTSPGLRVRVKLDSQTFDSFPAWFAKVITP